MFSYVRSGWDGSAHDARVLENARKHAFHVPKGKYYLADAGYGLSKHFLTPYRGVRYHLREFGIANQRKDYLFIVISNLTINCTIGHRICENFSTSDMLH